MGRVEQIKRNQIYEVRDGGVAIYRGQTRLSLKERLRQLYSNNNPVGEWLHRVDVNSRRDDITIREIEYDSEREAVCESWWDLLNWEIGEPEPEHYGGYEWDEEGAALVGKLPDAEVTRQTGADERDVRIAREKLGLPSPRDYGSSSGSTFSKSEVFQIRETYMYTDASYSELGEKHGVGSGTIGRLVKGETYEDVDYPEFTDEQGQEIRKRSKKGESAYAISRRMSISVVNIRNFLDIGTVQGRVQKIKKNVIYELRDDGTPIYRGQTRMPLEDRRKVHLGSAASRGSVVSDWLEMMKEEGREDDLEIVELENHDHEESAVSVKKQELLNEKTGQLEPRPWTGYDWTEEEAGWLGEIPDKEIARRTGLGQDTIRLARNKLGLESPGAVGSGHGFSFDDETVLEIRRKHKNTDASYEQLAEEYGVGEEAISHLVRGKTYAWVPHPEFSQEEKEQIETQIEQGNGAAKIAQLFRMSAVLVREKFNVA